MLFRSGLGQHVDYAFHSAEYAQAGDPPGGGPKGGAPVGVEELQADVLIPGGLVNVKCASQDMGQDGGKGIVADVLPACGDQP